MLVACRLAGLSALETYYGGVRVGAQSEAGGRTSEPVTCLEPSANFNTIRDDTPFVQFKGCMTVLTVYKTQFLSPYADHPRSSFENGKPA